MGAAPGDGRLKPADQILYRGEKESRTRTGMVTVGLFDRAPDWDRFLAAFDRASRVVPRMRQKVVEPSLPTTMARWVVDADFDLRYHVRRRVVAGDGSHRELLDLAEQSAMTPLDPHRPLWVVTLLTGLEGGRAATVLNMSHAVADGAGTVRMFGQIFDNERDAPLREMPLEPVPHDLDRHDLTISGFKEIPGRAVGITKGVVGAGLKSIGNPVGSAGSVASYAASLGRVVASMSGRSGKSGTVTPSPLLAGRGASRRSATLDLELSALREAAHALGGTVNDAYLAGICAVLRRYHEAKGVPIDRIPMAIPVNVRGHSQSEADGNHWSAMWLGAPVGEADPGARIAEIHETIRAGRAEPALDVLGTLSTVLSVLPDIVFGPALGSLTPVDVQASNVMSTHDDVYLGGAKFIAHYGLGPVPGIAIMFVLVSHVDKAFVTARYDTASIQDDETFERCLQEGFGEVLAAGLPEPEPIRTPEQPSRAARLAPRAAKSPAPAKKSAAKKTTQRSDATPQDAARSAPAKSARPATATKRSRRAAAKPSRSSGAATASAATGVGPGGAGQAEAQLSAAEQAAAEQGEAELVAVEQAEAQLSAAEQAAAEQAVAEQAVAELVAVEQAAAEQDAPSATPADEAAVELTAAAEITAAGDGASGPAATKRGATKRTSPGRASTRKKAPARGRTAKKTATEKSATQASSGRRSNARRSQNGGEQ